jgi:hypothetical protein
LCASDLSSARTYRGIVRHVLGLEWSDTNAGVCEEPAKTGNHHTLADIRGSSHHHQTARAHSLVIQTTRSFDREHASTGADGIDELEAQ